MRTRTFYAACDLVKYEAKSLGYTNRGGWVYRPTGGVIRGANNQGWKSRSLATRLAYVLPMTKAVCISLAEFGAAMRAKP